MFLGNDTAMVTGIQKGLLETICSGPGNLWVLSETTISLRRVPGEALCTLAHTSCLENPMDGGAWWAAVHGGREESDMTERLHFHSSPSCIGEGNGNPLQCSCLENPRDGEA